MRLLQNAVLGRPLRHAQPASVFWRAFPGGSRPAPATTNASASFHLPLTGPFPGIPCSRILFSPTPPAFLPYPPRDPATIFHSELIDLFGLHKGGPEPVDQLLVTLRQLQAARIRTVMFSISWAWLEPAQGQLRWGYLEDVVGSACSHTELKVTLIVDLMRAPDWLFVLHPGAAVLDAGGRNYSHLSWFHSAANEVALGSLRQVVEGLSAKYEGCISGVQPVYNNEYEAKYTQEFDSYQDYNAAALASYRSLMRTRVGGDLGRLNARWETQFSSFWDWQQFRVHHGASVFNQACAVVQAAGVRCFHHFPEFFSVLDAVYGAAMFKHIAASPHTDFLIMDSNFRTSTGALMDPRKLRLYIAAAHAYGKPTYFEAAVERFADVKLLQAGYAHALLAGASNMGLTNWLGRINITDPQLAAAMHERAGMGRHGQACARVGLWGLRCHRFVCRQLAMELLLASEAARCSPQQH
eukprot:XP_001702441.1 predicted protein [Chlamydomonas reinhardtii]